MTPFLLIYVGVSFGVVGASMALRGEFFLSSILLFVSLIGFGLRYDLDRRRGRFE